MFRPPSIFFANRKAGLLKRALDVAGHHIDQATARHTVARAWGWLSWPELSEVLERPAAPSPFDEDLVGAGAMAALNRLVVAERRGDATRAIQLAIGLPPMIATRLGGFVRFTARQSGSGTCLSPETFRRLYAEAVAPRPPFVVELLEGMRASGDRPPGSSLPPYRPR